MSFVHNEPLEFGCEELRRPGIFVVRGNRSIRTDNNVKGGEVCVVLSVRAVVLRAKRTDETSEPNDLSGINVSFR